MLPDRYKEITVENLGKAMRINADLYWINKHQPTKDNNNNNTNQKDKEKTPDDNSNNNNNNNNNIVEILHHKEFIALVGREKEIPQQ